MRRVALVVVCLAACIAGCGNSRTYSEREMTEPDVTGRFVSSNAYDRFRIVIDSETGVQYLMCSNGHKDVVDGITVLVDQYGYPILAQGYERKTEIGE